MALDGSADPDRPDGHTGLEELTARQEHVAHSILSEPLNWQEHPPG
jgi:hypothetical protein